MIGNFLNWLHIWYKTLFEDTTFMRAKVMNILWEKFSISTLLLASIITGEELDKHYVYRLKVCSLRRSMLLILTSNKGIKFKPLFSCNRCNDLWRRFVRPKCGTNLFFSWRYLLIQLITKTWYGEIESNRPFHSKQENLKRDNCTREES